MELNQNPDFSPDHHHKYGSKYFWMNLNMYHEHMQHFRLHFPRISEI